MLPISNFRILKHNYWFQGDHRKFYDGNYSPLFLDDIKVNIKTEGRKIFILVKINLFRAPYANGVLIPLKFFPDNIARFVSDYVALRNGKKSDILNSLKQYVFRQLKINNRQAREIMKLLRQEESGKLKFTKNKLHELHEIILFGDK